MRADFRTLSDEYQKVYQQELHAFWQRNKETDRYKHMKSVFLARHSELMAPEAALRAAEQDAMREIERDFEFPEESVWLQDKYDRVKSLN